MLGDSIPCITLCVKETIAIRDATSSVTSCRHTLPACPARSIPMSPSYRTDPKHFSRRSAEAGQSHDGAVRRPVLQDRSCPRPAMPALPQKSWRFICFGLCASARAPAILRLVRVARTLAFGARHTASNTWSNRRHCRTDNAGPTTKKGELPPLVGLSSGLRAPD